MKRRYRLIFTSLGSLAVLVLMFVWLTGNLSCQRKIAPGKVAVEDGATADLKTVEVQTHTIPVETEVVGTITAREQAEMSSRIMAEVLMVAVDAGDAVRKGQSLIVLDSRDAEARLAQAREQLVSAQAILKKARLDAGRIKRLLEKEAATKQEYDHARAMLKTARAGVDAARAAVREAEVFLSHTTIVSSMNGIVVDRFVEPGDMAAPGKPLLSAYDPSTLRLEVAVPEHLREKVALGKIVKTRIESVGETFDGEIEEIVPAADPMSRSFLARVAIQENEKVYPGMYGKVRLPLRTTEVVLIPPEALRRVGQLETVTVLVEGSPRTRAVKTGKTHPEGVEILSGLAPAETIILP